MDLDIDRLTLQVVGLSEEEGSRLALRVAERLLAADATMPSGYMQKLRISIPAGSGEDVESLSCRIVSGLVDSFGRLPW